MSQDKETVDFRALYPVEGLGELVEAADGDGHEFKTKMFGRLLRLLDVVNVVFLPLWRTAIRDKAGTASLKSCSCLPM